MVAWCWGTQYRSQGRSLAAHSAWVSESRSVFSSLFQTLCDPMDYIVHGILQTRILEWVAFPFSRGSSNPGIEPGSPTLQVDSLPAEPQGKPKNTGVGSLSLHQSIFLTQELKPGSPALQVDSLPTELWAKPIWGSLQAWQEIWSLPTSGENEPTYY